MGISHLSNNHKHQLVCSHISSSIHTHHFAHQQLTTSQSAIIHRDTHIRGERNGLLRHLPDRELGGGSVYGVGWHWPVLPIYWNPKCHRRRIHHPLRPWNRHARVPNTTSGLTIRFFHVPLPRSRRLLHLHW